MSQNPAPIAPPAEAPKSYVVAWIAALLLIIVFIFGLLMFPPTFNAAKDVPKPADSVLFVGRFHPIVVHVPIGALMVLVLFEMLCLGKKGEAKFGTASLLLLTLGAAGAVAGVLVGIMLSREGGYEGGNLTLHQAIGIGGTSGVLLALTLRISAMGSGHGGLMDCYRIVYLLSLSFISLGAHFGGNISHGNKFLTQFAPPWIGKPMTGFEKWMLGLVEKPKNGTPKEEPPATTPEPPAPVPAPSPAVASKGSTPANPPVPVPEPATGGPGVAAEDSATVFQDVLMPLLEAKCNKCHNEAKSKGDLRMDTHELLLKGGSEEGKTVIPGKPDESLAISRIKLAIDDDDHMPPEGKDQMTTEETALLHWWIKEGASAALKVKDAKFPAELKPLVESLLKK